MRRTAAAVLLFPLLIVFLACASSSSKDAEEAKDRRISALESLALMRQGSLYLQQGRYEEALETLKKADGVAPGNATTHNMIGLCHLRMGSYDLALDSFNRSLSLIPAFTDARNNRGTVYLATSQFRLAEVDFAAVLADTTYPHHWEAFYNLGLANLGVKNLAGAEDNFRRAMAAPSPIFEAFLRMAEIKQQRGDLTTAEELLEEAMIKFPDRPEAVLALGRLLTTLGRHDEARPHLERIISSYPDSEIAAEAARYLEN